MKLNEYEVLLIDDDEDDYVYLRELFLEVRRSKYKVTWKSSYQEGLQALHTRKFDVCLLDYRLGERTGIDLLNETQKLGHPCPIIFLTGHGDFDLDVQAMQMGASEFLVKGTLSSPLLERTVRYAMKHALDMAELRESKAQILQQDRLASLGLLASSLAHEIGTPLGVIRSRAELVTKKTTVDAVKKDMDTIVTQIDRIAKLVHSLLNLAREKKSELARPTNLNDVFTDILNLLEHEFCRNGIALRIPALDAIVVNAEAGPLGQVLLNLLVNSLHAIEAQKKIYPEITEHTIDIKTQSQGLFIDISIHDSGCGIPDANLPQLFTPFFTTKDIGHGTGLGLATSLKLVQSWGGNITAQNAPNHGAIFTIRLVKGTHDKLS